MEIPKYNFPVTLIPGGCPQFLDFCVHLAELDNKTVRFTRTFYEEPLKAPQEAGQRANYLLRCLAEDENGHVFDMLTNETIRTSSYDIEANRCLEPFYEQWFPLPIFRIKDKKREDGSQEFEGGPTNWARCYIVRPLEDNQKVRVILAFDTTVEERPETGNTYFAPSPGDVDANAVYRLAWHVRDNTWFMNAPWVDRWIHALFTQWRSKDKRKGVDSEFCVEYLAYYYTLLDYLNRILPDTRVRVINPDRDNPVEVDLILDIGNSRTTGILVESLPQRTTNLNNSYLLQIRDLSNPENVYTDPFATRVEFSEPVFGDDSSSKLSGKRKPAFPWASSVRMGLEAARLSTKAKCSEGTTGMSSPKRYLWDERIWKPTWRFNAKGDYEPMVTRGSFARLVNHMGTPLCCFDDALIARHPLYRKQEQDIAFESQFTRSSIMMFLLSEIITQALVTINSPMQRQRRELSDFPRRLRRIVFTVPSGMPIAEQRIYRRWVKFAVRTVWQALGWEEYYLASPGQKRGAHDYRLSPETRCSWDEASCTQIVYLYNEIVHKFNGDAHVFFHLYGKHRPQYGNPYPSLRVASIDVGGGTTDLSITTHLLDNPPSSSTRIRPRLNLRDGFNVAGDDILRAVITDCVLQAIAKAVAEQGVPNPRYLLAECFGRDVLDNSQENRNLRAQFARQVAAPIGMALLSAYEKMDPLRDSPLTFKFSDFFHLPTDIWSDAEEEKSSLPLSKAPAPAEAIGAYVEKAVKKAAPDSNYTLLDTPLTLTHTAIENCINTTVKRILDDLCELTYLADCDILLLSGRPSKLHALISTVINRLPVPPHRVIPMCEYRAGRWYPFVDHLGLITDPKTTVSMGAILLALAEGHLEGFSFNTSSLNLQSTARYIGELDNNGALANEKVWFEVDVESGKEQDLEKDILFNGPLSVGFRQFPVSRWPTTRFYLIDFATENDRHYASSNARLPYTLTLRFLQRGAEDSTVRGETDEGELSVVAIQDSNGNEPRGGVKAIEVRLQTLPLEDGHWLDTGVLV